VPGGNYTSLDKVEILCDNQVRLRGSADDYNDVFNNFNDPHYIGPEPRVYLTNPDDDEVPF
jgi:hypothetical protein